MAKMCKRHPDKPAIIRSDGVSTGRCQECMDLNVRKARAARGKGTKTEKVSRPRRKKAPENGLLSLDFTIYPELLEKLKELAKEEFRPLEMEILFLLKVQTQETENPPETPGSTGGRPDPSSRESLRSRSDS